MLDFNSITCRGVTVSVQHLPDRKSPYLCVSRDGDNGICAFARFNSERGAEEFIVLLAEMFGVTEQGK